MGKDERKGRNILVFIYFHFFHDFPGLPLSLRLMKKFKYLTRNALFAFYKVSLFYFESYNSKFMGHMQCA